MQYPRRSPKLPPKPKRVDDMDRFRDPLSSIDGSAGTCHPSLCPALPSRTRLLQLELHLATDLGDLAAASTRPSCRPNGGVPSSYSRRGVQGTPPQTDAPGTCSKGHIEKHGCVPWPREQPHGPRRPRPKNGATRCLGLQVVAVLHQGGELPGLAT